MFGHLIADKLALVNGAAIGLRGHRGCVKMARTLFELAEVGEHIKKFSRASRFYAVTARMMNVTSVSDAPRKERTRRRFTHGTMPHP